MGLKIFLYDTETEGIGSGPLSSISIKQQLEAAGSQDIDVHISSAGGSAFDAIAIYDLLKKHPGTVTTYIDALAASAASVVAMAGKRIVMSKYALLMVHKPMAGSGGNADELLKDVQMLNVVQGRLSEIYQDQTGLDEVTINSLINAVTWMTADQALALGFIHEIEDYSAEVTNAAKMKVYAECAPAVYQRVINKLPINKQTQEKPDNMEGFDKKGEGWLKKVMNYFASTQAEIKTVSNKGTLVSYQPLAKGVKVFNEADEPAEDSDEYEITNAEGKKVKAKIKDGVINEMEEDKAAEATNEVDEKEAKVMNAHGIKVTNKAEIPAVLNLIKKVDEQNGLLAEAKIVINALTEENKKTETEIRAKIQSEFKPEGSKRSDKIAVKNTATFVPTSEAAKNAAKYAVAKSEGKA